MQKAMQVCDLCNRISDKMGNKVIIGETTYGEVCDSCVARLTTFTKNLAIRKPSNYSKKKAQKEAESAAEPASAEAAKPAPEGQGKGKGIFGR